MKFRRSTRLLVEPSSVTTGDIAFNLIVFFLVCASVQPDSGRKQSVPRSEQQKEAKKAEHIEVRLTRTTAAINGDAVRARDFVPRLKALLAGKIQPEDRVVVVRSAQETAYSHWIAVTAMIEEAGGVITVLREEEREVQLPR